MNKTLLAIGIFTIATVGLIGVIFILILAPDQADKLIQFVSVISGFALNAAVMIYGLGKIQKGQQAIAKNVNGNIMPLIDHAAKTGFDPELVEQYRANAQDLETGE